MVSLASGSDFSRATDLSSFPQIPQPCAVCGEQAAGFHFGGCKSFFGRSFERKHNSHHLECKQGGQCEVTGRNRTSCKSCRFKKCLRVGMSKSGSRYGRRSNWFKIHCLLQTHQETASKSALHKIIQPVTKCLKIETVEARSDRKSSIGSSLSSPLTSHTTSDDMKLELDSPALSSPETPRISSASSVIATSSANAMSRSLQLQEQVNLSLLYSHLNRNNIPPLSFSAISQHSLIGAVPSFASVSRLAEYQSQALGQRLLQNSQLLAPPYRPGDVRRSFLRLGNNSSTWRYPFATSDSSVGHCTFDRSRKSPQSFDHDMPLDLSMKNKKATAIAPTGRPLDLSTKKFF